MSMIAPLISVSSLFTVTIKSVAMSFGVLPFIVIVGFAGLPEKGRGW